MSSAVSRYGFTVNDVVRLASPGSKAEERLVGRVTGFSTAGFEGKPLVMASWLAMTQPVGYPVSELAHSQALCPELKYVPVYAHAKFGGVNGTGTALTPNKPPAS
ncbi:hypothetical protein [Streptomyces olivoreticuli]|uniref:hypothetical protein n=1 Tax=Streptomyces olivoreticuli TaxID=68246 RepID=UPI000E2467AC|nr:hypothetical protein [Streptomyces olivoreticuli]